MTLDQTLQELVDLPVDRAGLRRSFNEMVILLEPLLETPQIEQHLPFVYRRIIKVFETEEGADDLFYRADYMLCLLARTTTDQRVMSQGITLPTAQANAIRKSFDEMKQRHNYDGTLPCEEYLPDYQET
jgi:hypothetical protein